MENTGALEEVQGYFINLTLRLTETSNHPFEKSERITTKNGQDVLENILELREYDVQYYVRVAIDCGTVLYFNTRSKSWSVVFSEGNSRNDSY